MKQALAFLFVIFSVQLIQAAPPSDESINKMLTVTHVDKMIDQMITQMNNGMKAGMDQGIQQSLNGKEMTAAQKAAVEKFENQLTAMMKEELSLDKLRDIYLQAYRETFTQQEIDAVIAFYSTPAGQSLVEKVPLVMQKAAVLVQGRLGPMLQKVQTMQTDFLKDLSNAK